MTTLNRHLTAQKLYEALLEQGRHAAGAPMTWGDLREFMRGIRNPGNTYVKALQFSSGRRLPETFDVWNQFAWETSQNSAYLAVVQSDNAINDQTKVSDWMNDLNAENGPSADTPVKMYWTSQPAGPQNGTSTYDFSIIYDDEYNVVFIVKDLTGSGKSWNDVRQYIDSIRTIANALNLDGVDSESIASVMPDVINSNLEDGQAERLLSLLRPGQAQQFRQNQPMAEPEHADANPARDDGNDNDTDNNDTDNNDTDNNDNDDLSADDIIDNLDDDQDNETPTTDETPPEKEEEVVRGEDCNGMQVLGEIAAADIPAEWSGGDEAIAFGGESFDDFKRGMRQYPRNAVHALTSKPVRYCRVDFGNPNGAKKAYLDVYRNFRFFIFESKDDIRWYQSNKGNAAFFKMSSGNTPRDMFAMLRGGRSGLEFIGFFYGRVRAEARRGGTAIQNIWSASERFTKMTSTAQGTPATGRPQTPTGKKISDFQRRRYIEGIILQRLENEVVGRWKISRPITKNSDRNVILAGSKPGTDRYGNVKYRKHTIGKGDAQRLSRSYDDWHWLDNPANQTARNMLATLTRILDASGIEPPPEQEEIMLPPAEQEKLDKTLDAVNDKLGDAGIEVQITVPGHKPRYKWQPGFTSHQGQGWPTDGRFFAVMIAGIDPYKLFDTRAEQFLKDMEMWRFLQGAYEEAKKEYPDMRLAVALDNGL